MFISASQIKMVFPVWHPSKVVTDHTECGLAWYNKYVKKLPVPPFKAGVMGSAIHTCIENYLKAGDLSGHNPFEGDWSKGLNTNEIDTVKELVTRGIDEGFILKYDQREVEAPMSDGKDNTTLLKALKPTWRSNLIDKFAPATWEIVPGVLLNGYIDLIHDGNKIKDWKSSSNPQRYGLNIDQDSLNYIGHDIQLLIYTTWLRYVRKVTGPITVSHTYFQTKNGDTIKNVEAVIEPETITAFYLWLTQTVIPKFQELNGLSEGIANALPHGKDACKKYTGCPYQTICTGKLSEGEYRRTHKINNGVKKKTMGLFDKIKEKAPVTEVKVEEVVTAPIEKVEVVAEEKVEAPLKKVEVDPKQMVVDEELVEKLAADSTVTREDLDPKPKKRATIKFNLIIGAHVVKGFKVIYIQDLFNDITAEIAEGMKVESWFDLDPFRRVENFQKHKESIVAELHGKTVVANHCTHEVKHLLNVLQSYANVIVEATAGL
jgi:hypothetical protein